MTLIFPKVTLLDKVLACIGKFRCIVTPKNFNTIYSENPFIYVKLKRENWLRALFRRKGQ